MAQETPIHAGDRVVITDGAGALPLLRQAGRDA